MTMPSSTVVADNGGAVASIGDAIVLAALLIAIAIMYAAYRMSGGGK